MSNPARPRNAVELPIYTALNFGWWPPVQLSLARPWPDADHALRAQDARWTPETLAALTGATFDSETGRFGLDRDTVLVVERAKRRGRRRALDSMQFVLQFGMKAPVRAQAYLQIWRDDAIERRCLGTGQLEFLTDPWSRKVTFVEARIDQLIRASKDKIDLDRQAIIVDEIRALARVNAVVAARGTATLCGGSDAARLLAAAFERYRTCDDRLREIELPEVDYHGYAPEVVELAAAFCARGLDGLPYAAMPAYALRSVNKNRRKKGGAVAPEDDPTCEASSIEL